MEIFNMKKQGNTISQSLSLPADLSEEIDRQLYKHRRKMCNQKTSRSKFVAMLIKRGLEA